ncbi:MAG: class I SAM-dependent methyltransferase [Candidatus Limnocylindria bacterium]
MSARPAPFQDVETPQGRFVIVTRHPRSGREIDAFGGARRFRGKTVIDIGTGNGRLALDAARYARRVLAVDPNPEGIEMARRTIRERGIRNVELRLADARELDTGRERFDLAILSWSL